jgi:hypothetical protein
MDEDVEAEKIRLLGTPGSLFESIPLLGRRLIVDDSDPRIRVTRTVLTVIVINGHTTTADTPNTPVSIIPTPDVKIEMDYQELESDVRHDSIPIKSIQDSTIPNLVLLLTHVGPLLCRLDSPLSFYEATIPPLSTGDLQS